MTTHPILRYAAIYGLLSGIVIIAILIAGMNVGGIGHSMWFGYLVMLAALTFIFVGVKRYRDIEKGGVIRFLPALGTGLAIAVVAGIAYVAIWESYLAATGYRFMDDYIASTIAAQRAAGVKGAELAGQIAELEAMRVQYANPLIRLPMTFCEVFPVGFIVSLVSAAILRNPRVLPLRA
ncbi:DUF4199 domain-containing protein [Sphingomonas crocodyli]|uniref:DUF4199 domain-containing protein n=1 Tax=Sphingomonas crocodyli TaxID=1979270 RepID=A0A437LWL5_9SPHN|nr:DUF4199 domain-containing protein [Sphingomonas crocodyli]RVT89769.1 DUF4199 domain-containing protein [Sphingomonas crocodyli]